MRITQKEPKMTWTLSRGEHKSSCSSNTCLVEYSTSKAAINNEQMKTRPVVFKLSCLANLSTLFVAEVGVESSGNIESKEQQCNYRQQASVNTSTCVHLLDRNIGQLKKVSWYKGRRFLWSAVDNFNHTVFNDSSKSYTVYRIRST